MATEARRTPRISVNKLGEYLTATPARRKRIIRDQKYPPPYQVTRYRDAERAIVEFFAVGQDARILNEYRRRLAAATPESEFEANKVQLCVEAIDSFEDALDVLDLDGVAAVAGRPDPEHLEFAGVGVSVRPEVVLTGKDRAGPRAGCLKLYFAKNGPLDDRAGPYVSTVLAEFAEKHLDAKGRIDGRLVLTLDVFAGRVFAAPRARTRRLDDVTAACEEIAARWASI